MAEDDNKQYEEPRSSNLEGSLTDTMDGAYSGPMREEQIRNDDHSIVPGATYIRRSGRFYRVK